MKRNIIIMMGILLIITYCNTCNNLPVEPKNEYVNVNVIGLFNKPVDSAAVIMAKILNVYPIIFNKTVGIQNNRLTQYGSFSFLKEGYEYFTKDSAKLVVWTDSSDLIFEIIYDLVLGGNSTLWAYDKNQAESYATSILKKTGIELSDEVILNSGMHESNHYFIFNFQQKFQSGKLIPPIRFELAGDSQKVNYLELYSWVLNLSEIKQLISDEDLKKIVLNYLISLGEELDAEKINASDYLIIKNKLCRSYLYSKSLGTFIKLYVDIQNGEIVHKESVNSPR